MKTITVFTPTYNRMHLLKRVYRSLMNQTDYDFIWLVIDDGSTDKTKEYIMSLQNDKNPFDIEYIYKENGGLHTAYNEAIKLLNTELCICCDSDDWLPNHCIEFIKKYWDEKKTDECAGIIALDYTKDNIVIGKKLPDEEYIDLNELFIKGKLIGDKKLVVRSKLYQEITPMQTINNEKNFNPNYYNVIISEKYNWICLNENLCYVEYQPSGMTNNIFKQYCNSPNSFIELRKLYLTLNKATLIFKCRQVLHYDAECILAHRTNDIFNNTSPNKFLSILLFPFGFCLYIYIYFKGNK